MESINFNTLIPTATELIVCVQSIYMPAKKVDQRGKAALKKTEASLKEWYNGGFAYQERHIDHSLSAIMTNCII